jgi:hypothetical protein
MFALLSALSALAAPPTILDQQISRRGGTVVIEADIEAPPDRVMAVILALDERMPDVREVRSAAIYATTEQGFSVAYELRLFGMDHAFHVAYTTAPSAVQFHLDPAHRNDIAAYDGAYRIESTPTGTRLHYANTSIAKTWIPTFMRQRLVVGLAIDEVVGIQERSESP